MSGLTLFGLSVTFALVTGTGAGVLGLLSWEVFSRSTFGRVVLALTAMLWLFAFYHAFLLIYQEPIPELQLLRTGVYAGIAVFIALTLRMQLSIRPSSGDG